MDGAISAAGISGGLVIIDKLLRSAPPKHRAAWTSTITDNRGSAPVHFHTPCASAPSSKQSRGIFSFYLHLSNHPSIHPSIQFLTDKDFSKHNHSTFNITNKINNSYVISSKTQSMFNFPWLSQNVFHKVLFRSQIIPIHCIWLVHLLSVF